jgi:hypothetical protein
MKALLLILIAITFSFNSFGQKGQASPPNYQLVTPTTGQTVVMNDSDGDVVLLVDPAANLSSLTITILSNPFDGQKVTMMTTKSITTLTLQGSTIVGTITSAGANAFATWIWSQTKAKWYRIG